MFSVVVKTQPTDKADYKNPLAGIGYATAVLARAAAVAYTWEKWPTDVWWRFKFMSRVEIKDNA